MKGGIIYYYAKSSIFLFNNTCIYCITNNFFISVAGHDETKTNVPPVFLVQLKDAEMLEHTLFRFMIKVMGDPRPRVKL